MAHAARRMAHGPWRMAHGAWHMVHGWRSGMCARGDASHGALHAAYRPARQRRRASHGRLCRVRAHACEIDASTAGLPCPCASSPSPAPPGAQGPSGRRRARDRDRRADRRGGRREDICAPRRRRRAHVSAGARVGRCPGGAPFRFGSGRRGCRSRCSNRCQAREGWGDRRTRLGCRSPASGRDRCRLACGATQARRARTDCMRGTQPRRRVPRCCAAHDHAPPLPPPPAAAQARRARSPSACRAAAPTCCARRSRIMRGAQPDDMHAHRVDLPGNGASRHRAALPARPACLCNPFSHLWCHHERGSAPPRVWRAGRRGVVAWAAAASVRESGLAAPVVMPRARSADLGFLSRCWAAGTRLH